VIAAMEVIESPSALKALEDYGIDADELIQSALVQWNLDDTEGHNPYADLYSNGTRIIRATYFDKAALRKQAGWKYPHAQGAVMLSTPEDEEAGIIGFTDA